MSLLTLSFIILILDFGLQCLYCLDLDFKPNKIQCLYCLDLDFKPNKIKFKFWIFFFKFIAGGTQLKTLDVKTVEVKVEPTSTKSAESLNTSTASNSSDGEGKICVEMS